MIDIALFRRTIRDYAWLWLAIALGLFLFVILFMYAVHATPIAQQKSEFIKLPFVRRLLTVMVGSDPLQMMTPTGISAFAFTHPLTWTLLIVFCLTMTTGVLAGEIDWGTMDLLGTLPLTRVKLYWTLLAAGLALALPLTWVAWLGVLAGKYLAEANDVRMDLLIRVAWHLCAVMVLIVSFSTAISAMCQRRGAATAISFLLVFYAFVMNVLRAFWSGLDVLKWSDFLYYYSSMKIVLEAAYQWRDLGVLLGASVVWGVIGAMAWNRRDIPAR